MKPAISILFPDLRGGDAEQMRIHMAREWVGRWTKVEFVQREAGGELLNEVPESVDVVKLGAGRFRGKLLPVVRYPKTGQPNSLLASIRRRTGIAPITARVAGPTGWAVVSEHNNLTAAYVRDGAVHHFAMVPPCAFPAG